MPVLMLLLFLAVVAGVVTGPLGLITVLIMQRSKPVLFLASPALTMFYLIVAGRAVHRDGMRFHMAPSDAGMAINVFLLIQLVLLVTIFTVCSSRDRIPAMLLGHASAAFALFAGFSMSMSLTGHWL